MNKNIIVYNDKGGVGKSTVVSAIMLAAAVDGVELKGIEAENQPRLAKRYSNAFAHIKIDDSSALIDQDLNAAAAQFDPLFDALKTGGILGDLGANVSGKFFALFEASGADMFIGNGENVALVLVTTAESEAIQSALKNAQAAEKLMPAAKKFMVVNEYRGAIPDDSAFIARMKEAGFEIARIRNCTAQSWGLLREQPITELATVTREQLMKVGIVPALAAREATVIKKFIDDMLLAAKPVVNWVKA